MRIGYRLCGSCNPMYSTGALLKKIIAADEENEYVFFDEGGYDALLTISGCKSDCTVIPEGCVVPCISVAGESVDGVSVEKSKLCSTVIRKVRQIRK